MQKKKKNQEKMATEEIMSVQGVKSPCVSIVNNIRPFPDISKS